MWKLTFQPLYLFLDRLAMKTTYMTMKLISTFSAYTCYEDYLQDYEANKYVFYFHLLSVIVGGSSPEDNIHN